MEPGMGRDRTPVTQTLSRAVFSPEIRVQRHKFISSRSAGWTWEISKAELSFDPAFLKPQRMWILFYKLLWNARKNIKTLSKTKNKALSLAGRLDSRFDLENGNFQITSQKEKSQRAKKGFKMTDFVENYHRSLAVSISTEKWWKK